MQLKLCQEMNRELFFMAALIEEEKSPGLTKLEIRKSGRKATVVQNTYK